MELQEISDRMEIREVITRYTRAIDTRNFDDLDHVFGDGAILDYSSVDGPVDTLDVARPWVISGLSLFTRYQHTIGQVAITFDGTDSAHATAYFINPLIMTGEDGKEILWEVGGYYHHDLVRTPDGWRSMRMVDENLYSRY